jgi:hypothetical protein
MRGRGVREPNSGCECSVARTGGAVRGPSMLMRVWGG